MRAARDFIGRLLFGQSPQVDFRTGLQAWVESANPEETGWRVKAMRRMIEARRNSENKVSTKLSLNRLRLSSLPPQIGELKDLRSLDLSDNRLNALP